MISKLEKVLYSTIKAYGTLHILEATDLIQWVTGKHGATCKSQVKIYTSPNIENNILRIDEFGRVDIKGECSEVIGDEYLEYLNHILFYKKHSADKQG